MIYSSNKTVSASKVLKDTVRESDLMFDFQSLAVIMMGNTDKKEALHAVSRYRKLHNDRVGFTYTLTTYPGDGRTSSDLLNSAMELFRESTKGTESPVKKPEVDDEGTTR